MNSQLATKVEKAQLATFSVSLIYALAWTGAAGSAGAASAATGA